MFTFSVWRTLYTNLLSSAAVSHKTLPLLAGCWKGHSSIAKHVKPKKRKGLIYREDRHFVDYKEVLVCGGKGGNGMLSFLSLSCQEWAGPDGGDGGNGGHVVFKASLNCKSLAHLNSTEKAKDGAKGRTKHRDGRNSEHHLIQVPLGTVVRSETGQLLSSLDNNGQLFVAARGGAGGKGNHFFLSNENRAPTIAELGAEGEVKTLKVEMKTMAHAGLIGFPNAGKSTLLRAISRAQPAVSAYPFTTLRPHLGMVLYDDHEQVAVADIPGLIPGAHLNYGLGISFLKHIERCLCLIYVIDLSVEQPWEQLVQLRFELNQYQEGLADRPSLLVGNKIDVLGAEEKLQLVREKLKAECDGRQLGQEEPLPVLGLSAKKLIGIDEFLQYLRVLYDRHISR